MERKALGKGLGALFPGRPAPEEEAGAPVSVIEVAVAEIEPNPYQPRGEMDPERLAELVESIRAHGILQPLLVRRHEDRYQLVAGERRFRAAQAAGLEKVPVVLRDCTNRDMLELALIENVQREDINPIDAAIAYRRLIDEFSLTQEDVATAVGKSRPAIANTIRLLNLRPEVRQKVATGEISEGHARALLSLEDQPDKQRAVLDRILASHLSVRDTERLVRDALKQAPKPDQEPPLPKDPHLARVEDELRSLFGTRVLVRRAGARGTITIEFYDDGGLENILAHILRS